MITFNLPLADLYRHAPLVFGHRGASFDAPANTLAAFRLARQMGADGVELDTSLTADGVPVVIHDFSVDETTDGTGRVRDFTLAQLKNLDAGSYFDHTFREERIPTLAEALDEIGPDMVVNIELKSTSWRNHGLESAVLAVIRKMHATRRVLISSFNPFALRRFYHLAPNIPIGFLYAPDTPVYLRLFMLAIPHQARHPRHDMVSKRFMDWAHGHRYRVNVWTVDNPLRMAALRDLGVDAIITNRPDVLLEVLGRANAQTRERHSDR
ncbi:MAG: glycerophosphodiester phosphodiesterase [Aggregatilineales bacterium]